MMYSPQSIKLSINLKYANLRVKNVAESQKKFNILDKQSKQVSRLFDKSKQCYQRYKYSNSLVSIMAMTNLERAYFIYDSYIMKYKKEMASKVIQIEIQLQKMYEFEINLLNKILQNNIESIITTKYYYLKIKYMKLINNKHNEIKYQSNIVNLHFKKLKERYMRQSTSNVSLLSMIILNLDRTHLQYQNKIIQYQKKLDNFAIATHVTFNKMMESEIKKINYILNKNSKLLKNEVFDNESDDSTNIDYISYDETQLVDEFDIQSNNTTKTKLIIKNENTKNHSKYKYNYNNERKKKKKKNNKYNDTTNDILTQKVNAFVKPNIIQIKNGIKSKYKCKICFKKYTSWSGTRAHVGTIHYKGKKLRCKICNKSFVFKYKLNFHNNHFH